MFAALAAPGSVDDLLSQVRVAIEFGEITEQHAPGGHPIFGAVADARELEAWLVDNAGLMGGNVLPSVVRNVQEKIGAIYDAAAGVRNDPELPPPATIWPEVKGLPWPWLAAGAGGLLLVAVLFQQRGRARR